MNGVYLLPPPSEDSKLITYRAWKNKNDYLISFALFKSKVKAREISNVSSHVLIKWRAEDEDFRRREDEIKMAIFDDLIDLAEGALMEAVVNKERWAVTLVYDKLHPEHKTKQEKEAPINVYQDDAKKLREVLTYARDTITEAESSDKGACFEIAEPI